MTTLNGTAAIVAAEYTGRTLSKYADPTEGARYGLTPDEARAVAREDPSLIYLDDVEPSGFVAAVAAEMGDRVADIDPGLREDILQAHRTDPSLTPAAMAAHIVKHGHC
jgi:hypothetical protein